jgi:hypothetical protein
MLCGFVHVHYLSCCAVLLGGGGAMKYSAGPSDRRLSPVCNCIRIINEKVRVCVRVCVRARCVRSPGMY